jgi:hypothetical protein
MIGKVLDAMSREGRIAINSGVGQVMINLCGLGEGG